MDIKDMLTFNLKDLTICLTIAILGMAIMVF